MLTYWHQSKRGMEGFRRRQSKCVSFTTIGGGVRGLPNRRLSCGRIANNEQRRRFAVKCCARAEVFEKITLGWVRQVVVGLHLCPFAEAVIRSERLRVVVCDGRTASQVRESVMREMSHLISVSEEQVQSTLIVAPEFCHEDFLEFREFCGKVEEQVENDEGLVDEVSVAWFHPEFEWGDADMDEAVHFDKRAPYPTINLLRVDELEKYIEQGRTQHILERNQATLREVGVERMRALYRSLVE